MAALMPDDYQLPEGFVNPVPDPDEKKSRPWTGRSLPDSVPRSGAQVLKGIGILIGLAFVFSDFIVDIADDQITDAADAAKEWAGVNESAANGKVKLDDSSVTASYTPSGGESITEGEYNGTGFTGSQWILTMGNESITLRDYRFDKSPVENADVTASYYKASAKEMNESAGREVDINPIRVDGHRGMVWRAPVEGRGWLLLAEFPGDPSTVRLRCAGTSSDSTVATQCEEVLDSLQFGE